ncbi:hypothetical protein WICPIJ_005267 [Wickerhamomyces pijperi]|uniref:Uncharacterized protein n=1 Tax=Wickerhamomyces pijperi TaxID=599730 RepID=A0A9P8TL96_WICPI|nr:hypothetical protein WICPIJ_005267 [Wickerhamomyces pijperi]
MHLTTVLITISDTKQCETDTIVAGFPIPGVKSVSEDPLISSQSWQDDQINMDITTNDIEEMFEVGDILLDVLSIEKISWS